MTSHNSKKHLHLESKSLSDYVLLIRNNFKTFLFISLIIIGLTLVYAVLAKNIYKSTVTVRITQQNQSVLQNTRDILDTELLDRFIATEIGVVGNYDTREVVAHALIDSFENAKNF